MAEFLRREIHAGVTSSITNGCLSAVFNFGFCVGNFVLVILHWNQYSFSAGGILINKILFCVSKFNVESYDSLYIILFIKI